MKLELKHIVGYLPYGLKVRLEFNPTTCLPWYYENDDQNHLFELEGMMLDWYNRSNLTKITPLLRPLSSLYTPLEDGSVPIELIGKMFEPDGELILDDGIYYYGWNTHVCDDFQGYNIGWNSAHNWFGIYYDEYDFEHQHENFTGDVLPYNKEVLDYLYQHHFDIHHLIEQGIALDINQVK